MPNIIVNVRRRAGYNCYQEWHSEATYENLSRKLNRLLRHSIHLPVNQQGFSFVEDVVYALGHYTYRLTELPTVADIMFLVATQDRGRYEATSLRGTGAARDFMVQPIQGHSGGCARQIDLDQAHTRLTDRSQIPVLAHHTNSNHLFDARGARGAPGLIPGGPPGRGHQERRDTTHCSMSLATHGVVPDKFRKRGTDCAITLDVDLLLQDGIRLYRSAAGVILIPDTVAVKYIIRATLINNPELAMCSRPRVIDTNAM